MEKLFKLLQSDKVLHFLLCYFITTLGHWYFIGAVVSLLLAGYKEYYDSKHTPHQVSWWDFIAGVLGITTGCLLIII